MARLLQAAGLDVGARAQPPHPDGARPDRPHPLELLLPLRGARHREEDAARLIAGILIGPRPGLQLDVSAQHQAAARQQGMQQIHRETAHRLTGQLIVVRGICSVSACSARAGCTSPPVSSSVARSHRHRAVVTTLDSFP